MPRDPVTCLCCMLPEAQLQTYQRGDMFKEVHKPRQIHNLLSHHTHITKQTQQKKKKREKKPRHNRDTPSRKTRSETHPHTKLTPQTCLAVSQRWMHSLETPSDKSEVHICMQARTQTHADSLHTGASIHRNPQICPFQAGTDSSSQPSYLHCLFHKESSRHSFRTPRAHRHVATYTRGT